MTAAVSILSFSYGPVVLTTVGTILVIWATIDANRGTGLRIGALLVALILLALLVGKTRSERRQQVNVRDARHATLKNLYNLLGPALDITAEIALLDPDEIDARKNMVRNVAQHCCAALAKMTPAAVDARAAVFSLQPGDPDEVEPIAQFGRRERPRTFRGDTTEGAEVLTFLSSPSPDPELFADTLAEAPPDYRGATDRYRTFIRVSIYANHAVFGMLTLDAPRPGALTIEDVVLVQLVASQMAVAFAIAAG